MLDFDDIQNAGKRSAFQRARQGRPLPGHMRTRPRTPEKQRLLIQAVRDAYMHTPPRVEYLDGTKTLVLPWLL